MKDVRRLGVDRRGDEAGTLHGKLGARSVRVAVAEVGVELEADRVDEGLRHGRGLHDRGELERFVRLDEREELEAERRQVELGLHLVGPPPGGFQVAVADRLAGARQDSHRDVRAGRIDAAQPAGRGGFGKLPPLVGQQDAEGCGDHDGPRMGIEGEHAGRAGGGQCRQPALGNVLDLPVEQFLAEREDFVESLDVVEMHVVHAAPADVVVGVVLQQRIPRSLEQRRVDARQAVDAGPCGQWLDHAGQQGLGPVVQDLEIDPRGEHVAEQRMVRLPQEVADIHRQRVGRCRAAEFRQVVFEAAESQGDVGLRGIEMLDQRLQIVAGGQVVSARGQQHDRLLLKGQNPRERVAQPLPGPLLAGGKAVVPPVKALLAQRAQWKVALAEKGGEHLGSVRRPPHENGTVAIAKLDGHAPHEEKRIDAEAGEDLWQLGEMPERVGNIAHPRSPAMLDGRAQAALQVTDQRLGPRQEAIRHRVPRAQRDASRLDQGPDPPAVLWTDDEMVFEDHGLPVEDEGRQPAGLEQVEQFRHHLDQPQPVGLKREVPRPIPVRVGNDDSGAVRGHGRFTLVRIRDHRRPDSIPDLLCTIDAVLRRGWSVAPPRRPQDRRKRHRVTRNTGHPCS